MYLTSYTKKISATSQKQFLLIYNKDRYDSHQRTWLLKYINKSSDDTNAVKRFITIEYIKFFDEIKNSVFFPITLHNAISRQQPNLTHFSLDEAKIPLAEIKLFSPQKVCLNPHDFSYVSGLRVCSCLSVSPYRCMIVAPADSDLQIYELNKQGIWVGTLLSLPRLSGLSRLSRLSVDKIVYSLEDKFLLVSTDGDIIVVKKNDQQQWECGDIVTKAFNDESTFLNLKGKIVKYTSRINTNNCGVYTKNSVIKYGDLIKMEYNAISECCCYALRLYMNCSFSILERIDNSKWVSMPLTSSLDTQNHEAQSAEGDDEIKPPDRLFEVAIFSHDATELAWNLTDPEEAKAAVGILARNQDGCWFNKLYFITKFDEITQIKFSPDGKTLVLDCTYERIQQSIMILTKNADKKWSEHKTIKTDCACFFHNKIIFSSDSNTLAVQRNSGISLWVKAADQWRFKLQIKTTTGSAETISFSPHSNCIAIGTHSRLNDSLGGLEVWGRKSNGEWVLKATSLTTSRPVAVLFSPDGCFLVVTHLNGDGYIIPIHPIADEQ
ncbi:MAG: hypothetical protein HAW66_00830 [Shewanella sp.]|nr:hypothetical protein [Shewanella sp.]